jgi:hypothetical protein
MGSCPGGAWSYLIIKAYLLCLSGIKGLNDKVGGIKRVNKHVL